MIKVLGENLSITKFPAGESLVRFGTNTRYSNSKYVIYMDFESNDDLINLALTADAIRRNAEFKVDLHLLMPYFPYARQDRVCNPGESLSTKVIADFINSLDFNHVVCYDLHSDVTAALVNNLHQRELYECIKTIGLVSIVSDSWDYWDVVTNKMPSLKDVILARGTNAFGQSKVVVRPDSGDPADIICGTYFGQGSTPQEKGTIQCLWESFGGTVNAAGYKELDSHIGLIYGDSITLERAKDILSRLKAKGFAASNVVLGIGSYTYQYQTRDSYGFAMKATYGVVDGEPREIFKDPKTDNGIKKSAKGLLRVEKEGNEFKLYDQQTPEQESLGELKTVFEDGKLLIKTTLNEMRERLKSN